MSKLLILNQSIADGLEVIHDRWSLLILREAFRGHTRFEQFIEETGITTLKRRRLVAAMFGTRRYDSFRKQLNTPLTIISGAL